MVVKEKARLKDHGKSTEKSNVQDNDKDLVKSIVDMLWEYNEIKRVVNNNYVILQSVVRNTVKSLGINAGNFDVQSFMDNFDVHELDLKAQDTFADSLAKVLSKFIIVKADNNAELLMEKAPYEVANRLSEVLKYLKENPHDSETISYAEELIKQLREFDRGLAIKYSRELENIVNPKPVNEPKAMVKVISAQDRERKLREIDSTVYILRTYMAYLSATPLNDKMFPYWLEQCKMYIEKLRKLDPQLASEYERELRRRVYEKEKYANYGKKKVSERKVRIKRASAKITEYFNDAENADNDKREWKRYLKGILKWIAVVAMI